MAVKTDDTTKNNGTRPRGRGNASASTNETDNNTNGTTNTHTQQPKKNSWDRNGDGKVTLSEVVGGVVQKLLDFLTLPISIAGYILDYFVDGHKGGVKVIGAVLFILGVLISADGIWQAAFRGRPFFPWSRGWLGWGWLVVWLNFAFWGAIVVSISIQYIESLAIRGQSPEQAKASYDEVKKHTVPKHNPDAIDLAERYRQQYKSAGMGEQNITGLVVILAYFADFWFVFSTNNPWGREPAALVGGVIWNLFTVFAAEFGFLLWKRATAKR